MIVKGRYVGQIEFDFEVNLDGKGMATPEEFKENLKSLNDNILNELKPLMEENSEDIKSTVCVTQQYLDWYEVEQDESQN